MRTDRAAGEGGGCIPMPNESRISRRHDATDATNSQLLGNPGNVAHFSSEGGIDAPRGPSVGRGSARNRESSFPSPRDDQSDSDYFPSAGVRKKARRQYHHGNKQVGTERPAMSGRKKSRGQSQRKKPRRQLHHAENQVGIEHPAIVRDDQELPLTGFVPLRNGQFVRRTQQALPQRQANHFGSPAAQADLGGGDYIQNAQSDFAPVMGGQSIHQAQSLMRGQPNYYGSSVPQSSLGGTNYSQHAQSDFASAMGRQSAHQAHPSAYGQPRYYASLAPQLTLGGDHPKHAQNDFAPMMLRQSGYQEHTSAYGQPGYYGSSVPQSSLGGGDYSQHSQTDFAPMMEDHSAHQAHTSAYGQMDYFGNSAPHSRSSLLASLEDSPRYFAPIKARDSARQVNYQTHGLATNSGSPAQESSSSYSYPTSFPEYPEEIEAMSRYGYQDSHDGTWGSMGNGYYG